MLSWLSFGIKDLLDIILVAILLYQLNKLLITSGSRSLFMGILAFLIIWVIVSPILQMKLLGTILDTFISGGFVLLVILFQDDIRRFLTLLGSRERWTVVSNLLFKNNKQDDNLSRDVAAITLACLNLSKKNCGALIVLKQKDGLEPFEHTGERIDASINARLIENIFFKNSPLHDGAMIVRDGRIVAAGCILPVSHSSDVPKELGLRHRSGLGMSVATDAKIIIVSEERGKISIAYEGVLTPNVGTEELQKFLLKKS